MGTLAAAPPPKATVDSAGFEKNVKPILKNTCSACHNATVTSGGVNLLPYLDASTIADDRPSWDKIVQKIESGEMPPKGIPRPPQPQIAALLTFVHGEFDKADAAVKPDPGRVTAKRLNRNEYRNTIRDLLAVDFRADKDFPTDDSGYGFDNIGDVLSTSPVLMEKYLNAAETIASRAMGADPLPKKPLEITYELKQKNLRRLDYSTVEASHRVDWDGEYTVIFGFPGERAADAKPVKMGFYMDGQLLQTIDVETKPSKLVYFNPFSDAQIRVYLPEGDHVFRAAFLDDEFVKTITNDKDAYNDKKNKYIGAITFQGPYPSKVEKASRKKILICDPATGSACVEKIVTNLAHHAYRRPPTKAEIAGLMKFVAMAKAQGQSTEQGIQLALEAMLVSPEFLFRVERDPNPTDSEKVHRLSDVELASRLSYFLWSSMPDDELLGLAEAGKLKDPATLDAQVKRMMTDRKAIAFADNFAGQWLEIRNLDSIKPDPQKFPLWTPELKEAMRTETSMFFQYVLAENRPLTEFIDAKYTFLNENLAKFYGIPGVKGPDFRRVELTGDQGAQRGGVLTQGSVLAVSSYPSRTSPTIRGKYILNNVLGTPPPPPPPDVPALDVEKVGSEVSLRKQLEAHRANAVCASCHSKMDVLGFGLENYDAIGKWRTVDGKFPIDVGGTMPSGKSFQTAAEMRTILVGSMPQISRCLIEKIMTYAMGRGMQTYDNRAIDQINKDLAADSYKFQTLIYDVVRSLPFQSRRGELVLTKNDGTQKDSKPKEIAQK
jgi:cytochrome c553